MTTRFAAAALCGALVFGALPIGFSRIEARAATQLERGSYLVNTIMACGNCHSPRDAQGKLTPDNALSGGVKFVTPAFVATAPNITPDPETGLGTWTDEDIKHALIEGLRPNHGPLAGTPLAAVMPANFYKALLPEDIDAIVVYLRSIKPVRSTSPDPAYKMPVTREPYPDAERGFSTASFSEPATHGKYLVTIGHCMECHAAWSRGVSDFNNGLGHGGRPFGPALVQGFGPDWQGAIASNITSDPTVGIGSWTDDEIKRAITKGIARDGHPLKPPMAYSFYAGLTDGDVRDIVAYLRTLPPLQ
ncbi:MAG: cytochrome c [Xanthobacteraceae bacterium]